MNAYLKVRKLLLAIRNAAVERKRALMAQLVTALMLTLLVMPTAPTFAQSTPTLELDLTPFFTSLNLYLPIFIGLFAIVGGISGAMALSQYVIGAIVRAFSGGGF